MRGAPVLSFAHALSFALAGAPARSRPASAISAHACVNCLRDFGVGETGGVYLTDRGPDKSHVNA
jgi:hypothetical protein